MLLLYADIGSYTPSFKQPTVPKSVKVVKYNKMSLSSLSGRESAVYLWGDGHISPTEMDRNGIGRVLYLQVQGLYLSCQMFFTDFFEKVP